MISCSPVLVVSELSRSDEEGVGDVIAGVAPRLLQLEGDGDFKKLTVF